MPIPEDGEVHVVHSKSQQVRKVAQLDRKKHDIYTEQGQQEKAHGTVVYGQSQQGGYHQTKTGQRPQRDTLEESQILLVEMEESKCEGERTKKIQE